MRVLKKAFQVALNLIKITFRDKSAILWLIIVPIFWTTLIGSVSTPGAPGIKIPVGIIQEDEKFLANFFVDSLSKDETLQVKFVESDKAMKLLQEKEIALCVIIPLDFTENLLNSKTASLEIVAPDRSGSYYAEEKVIKILKSIETSIFSSNFALKQIAKVVGMSEEKYKSLWNNVFYKTNEKLSETPLISVKTEFIKTKEIKEEIPSGMNATSPGFLTMFIMMGLGFAAASLVFEREERTLARLLTTPTSKFSILSGKMFGFFLIGTIQFLIFLFYGQFVLKVNWGNNLLASLIVGILFVFAVTGIATFIAAIVKTHQQAEALAILLSIVTSMLAGAWWPVEIMPQFMQNVAKFIPQYWAISAFSKIILKDASLSLLTLNIGILAAVGFIFLSLAVFLFKFE